MLALLFGMHCLVSAGISLQVLSVCLTLSETERNRTQFLPVTVTPPDRQCALWGTLRVLACLLVFAEISQQFPSVTKTQSERERQYAVPVGHRDTFGETVRLR